MKATHTPAAPAAGEAALRLLAYLEREYVALGYVYSASRTPADIARHVFGGDEEAADAALLELTAAGLVRRRSCPGERYELSDAERRRLVLAHGLDEAWARDEAASAFNPRGRFGEITSVIGHAAAA